MKAAVNTTCPACCACEKDPNNFVCKRCWSSLPQRIQARIYSAWQNYARAAKQSEQYPHSPTGKALLFERLKTYRAEREAAFNYLNKGVTV